MTILSNRVPPPIALRRLRFLVCWSAWPTGRRGYLCLVQSAASQPRFARRQLLEGYRVDSARLAAAVLGIGRRSFGFSFLPWWGFELGLSDRIWGRCISRPSSLRWPLILDEVLMIAVAVLRLAVPNWSGRVAVGDACSVAVWERIGRVDGCGFGFLDARCRETMYLIGFDGLWVRVGHHVVRRRVVGHGSSVEPRGVMGDV